MPMGNPSASISVTHLSSERSIKRLQEKSLPAGRQAILILILAFETAAVGLFASAVSAVRLGSEGHRTESRLMEMEGAIFLLIFGSEWIVRYRSLETRPS